MAAVVTSYKQCEEKCALHHPVDDNRRRTHDAATRPRLHQPQSCRCCRNLPTNQQNTGIVVLIIIASWVAIKIKLHIYDFTLRLRLQSETNKTFLFPVLFQVFALTGLIAGVCRFYTNIACDLVSHKYR